MSDQTLDEGLSQIYLQISPNILESFPKFRPPVDLYRFDEGLAQVKLLHKANERLGTKNQEYVAQQAEDNLLFLLRDDYCVYAKHLSKKLGLVLVEDDLSPVEVAEIFFLAFRDRTTMLFDQPQKEPYAALVKDITVLAEYLWTDPCRVEFLTKTMNKEYDLAVHSVNSMFIGLALFAMASNGKLEKATLVSLALGLLLHDLGMMNVPKFVVDKKQYLVRRDRDSIEKHIDAGESKLKRLGVRDKHILQCVTEHHERLDGSGYPRRLMNSSLSMAGRLCAVADSFSAIIGDRPYHDGKVARDAAKQLAQETKKYDEALTGLLVTLMTEGMEMCRVG